MHVIEVIPLKRGVQIESLSYFSSRPYDPGTFLQVPVRGKQLLSIVTDCKPVSATKTALKAATFSLRKLPEQSTTSSLPPSLLSTADALTRELPARRGSILYALLPPDVRAGRTPYPAVREHHGEEDPTPQILNAPTHERFVTYRSHIRTSFAHRGSVLLVVPTSAAVTTAHAALAHGIEERVVCFSPAQTKKQREAAYAAFDDQSTAKLIIATPAHAYLEREDLISIIIEQAASSFYHTRTRPYLDHRRALKLYAKVSNRSIILGDLLVRTEDEAARRSDRYQTLGEPPKRVDLTAALTVVKQGDKPTPEAPFSLVSPELERAITTTLEGRGKVFLYAARRGLAPVVVCFDCGHIFRCPDSGTPYSLLRTHKDGQEERWFLSTTSGKRVRAADVCSECGSWRLRERGIGIQHVYDDCRARFPTAPIVLFDHTSATTHKRALELMQRYHEQKGVILLGTNMALPYLSRPADVSAIVSLDATRTIPTWRADELLFHLLLQLRELTTKEVIVQTRSEPDDLLIYAGRGALERFYDDELALRKMVGYPPEAIFVLLSWSGPKAAVTSLEESLKSLLAEYSPRCYSSPRSTEKKVMRHCLLRIAQANWPNPTLMERLRSLPPQIKIEVDPDRIV